MLHFVLSPYEIKYHILRAACIRSLQFRMQKDKLLILLVLLSLFVLLGVKESKWTPFQIFIFYFAQNEVVGYDTIVRSLDITFVGKVNERRCSPENVGDIETEPLGC